MDYWVKQYGMGSLVDEPSKLMGFIDLIHRRESRNSPGTSADLFMAKRAAQALSDIYGINDYTPQGFNKWSEDTKQWIDPRPYPEVR